MRKHLLDTDRFQISIDLRTIYRQVEMLKNGIGAQEERIFTIMHTLHHMEQVLSEYGVTKFTVTKMGLPQHIHDDIKQAIINYHKEEDDGN